MARLVDVAARAGVSPSTVSNVFNNPDRVRAETRNQVLAAADDLGFRPNLVARSLRYGSSPLTAIVVSDARVPYVAEVVRSAQEELTAAGRLALVYSTDGDDDRLEAAVSELRAAGVNSFLFTPIPLTYSPGALELFQKLDAEGVAMAFLSNQLVGTGLDAITTNAADGSRQLVDHLVDLGHERIGFVGITAERGLTGSLRFEGFIEAMKRRSLPVPDDYIFSGPVDVETGKRAFHHFWSRPTRPTAILAIDDLIAAGLVLACHRNGVVVPDELSVTGMNDEPVARHVYPELTTMTMARVEAGRAAAQLLIGRTPERSGSDPTPRHLHFKLVVRESTGPPRPTSA